MGALKLNSIPGRAVKITCSALRSGALPEVVFFIYLWTFECRLFELYKRIE